MLSVTVFVQIKCIYVYVHIYIYIYMYLYIYTHTHKEHFVSEPGISSTAVTRNVAQSNLLLPTGWGFGVGGVVLPV